MIENKRQEQSEKACGRPIGRKKTAKIEIAIEPDVKNEFMQLLSDEGKNASAELCQWIRNYIKTNRERLK
ncbi:hypothetical protein [Succinivibrio dextrinosolvens]|uniref:hypothetical protein n=1 Tax=Succinivibrio dextrinosolvens TaxID=83771 RepID=UPI00241C021D|nr:hypothetical protein [Succinivibrio dextrinosolvens]MBE6422832.1 antitoxin [Succinivibrio dextrinosolvens]